MRLAERLSLKRLLRDDGGASATEYALVAGLMAVAIVACLAAMTPAFGDLMTTIADHFP